MLLMKAWMETRWRLLGVFMYLLICLALNYHNRNSGPESARQLLIVLGTVIGFGSLTLAGSGVRSQSAIGYPEGLAGSTQFTISLPVSRLRLLAVRATFGMLEIVAAAVVTGCLAWGLFPSVRTSVTAADIARLLLTTVVCVAAPYCATVFFATLVDEPLSFLLAGWMMMLLLWLAHCVAPAVDVVRVYGQASPLITHSLPWSQMATAAGLAAILLLAAVRVVQTREY